MAIEVTDEVLAGIVGNDPLVTLHAHKTDVIENVFERLVVFTQRAQRFIQHRTVGLRSVSELALEILPPCALRNEEGVVEIGVLAVLLLCRLLCHSLFDLTANNLLAFGVKHIRAALQEQKPKDVVLVCGCIETLLAKPVRSRVEVTFEFGEGKFGHRLRLFDHVDMNEWQNVTSLRVYLVGTKKVLPRIAGDCQGKVTGKVYRSVERGRIPAGLSETASQIRRSENWNHLSAVPAIHAKI